MSPSEIEIGKVPPIGQGRVSEAGVMAWRPSFVSIAIVKLNDGNRKLTLSDAGVIELDHAACVALARQLGVTASDLDAAGETVSPAEFAP